MAAFDELPLGPPVDCRFFLTDVPTGGLNEVSSEWVPLPRALDASSVDMVECVRLVDGTDVGDDFSVFATVKLEVIVVVAGILSEVAVVSTVPRNSAL